MIDDTLESIRRDIAAFADPATQVEVSDRGAEWMQRRRPRRVAFLRAQSSEFPDIQLESQRMGYREFFASERMADLKGLAENIAALMEAPRPYVQTRARVTEPSEREGDSDQLIRGLCTDPLPYRRTQVVFLRGHAGAGKTVLLRHLTARQASGFREGREKFLYLYVDAQGRALSRLDEAVAAVLNDLRAFTYHAVPVLARLGLLIPIIDGFDELLGIGGYHEAFASLASFIARLDGRGAIVTSARASFSAPGSLDRAATALPGGSRTMNYEIVPVELADWEDVQLQDYLELSGKWSVTGAATAEEGAAILRTRVGESGQALLRTPFFVSAVVQLLEAKRDVPPASRLLQDLARSFIEREVEKLQDKHGAPVLSVEQHERLLEIIADEMWWQGARELDADTVSTLAEVLCDEFALSPESSKALLGRVQSHALLRFDHATQRIAFHHEHYYALFLARRLIAVLRGDGSASNFLGRAVISPTVASEAAYAIAEGTWSPRETLERINTLRHPSLARELARSNSGVLVSALIRVCGPLLQGLAIRDAFFDHSDLRKTVVADFAFELCDLHGVDLRGVEWERVRLCQSQLVAPLVGDGTHLGIVDALVPDTVQGITVANGSERDTTYDPGEVAALLEKLGASLSRASDPLAEVQPPSDSFKARVTLLRRFLRMAGRVFRFSNEDLENKSISKQPEWASLYALLLKHGLIEESLVSKRGPNPTLMRLTMPIAAIEQAEQSPNGLGPASAFWRDLRSN